MRAWSEYDISEHVLLSGSYFKMSICSSLVILMLITCSKCCLLVLTFWCDSRRAYNLILFLVEFLADSWSTAIHFITINLRQYSWSTVLSTVPPCSTQLWHYLGSSSQPQASSDQTSVGSSLGSWPYKVRPTVDGVMVPRPWILESISRAWRGNS